MDEILNSMNHKSKGYKVLLPQISTMGGEQKIVVFLKCTDFANQIKPNQ